MLQTPHQSSSTNKSLMGVGGIRNKDYQKELWDPWFKHPNNPWDSLSTKNNNKLEIQSTAKNWEYHQWLG
jgi:hypothetical protein